MTIRMDEIGGRQAAGQYPGAAPTGTVTFVLGDMAGSTRLREDRPQEMAAVLARLVTSFVRRAGELAETTLLLADRRLRGAEGGAGARRAAGRA